MGKSSKSASSDVAEKRRIAEKPEKGGESKEEKDARRAARRQQKELKKAQKEKEKLKKSTKDADASSADVVEQSDRKTSKKSRKSDKAEKLGKSEKKEKMELQTEDEPELLAPTPVPGIRNGPAAKMGWNDWSKAEFGNDAQKDKFLRLMGGKNLHSTAKSTGNNTIVNEKAVLNSLEEQFEQARALQDKKRKGQRLALGSN